MKYLAATFLLIAGCSRFAPCDIATAIRKAAETGESIACANETIDVVGETVVGGNADGGGLYRVTITRGNDNGE